MVLALPYRPKNTNIPQLQPHVVNATVRNNDIEPIASIVNIPEIELPAFFMATAAGGGSDGNSGTTESEPLLTLGAVRDKLRTDTDRSRVYIRGGTYNVTSALSLNANDNSTEWLAYPGETPIIDGGGADISFFSLSSCSGITWKGLTFKNQGGTGGFENGGRIFNVASSNNCTIESCTFDTIRLGWYNSSGIATGWEFLGNTWDTVFSCGIFSLGGLSFMTVAGNTVDNVTYTGSHSGGFVHIYDIEDGIFEYNTLDNLGYLGFGFFTNNGPCLRNKVRKNIIRGFCKQRNDGGAIYCLGRVNSSHLGTEWNDNWVEDGGTTTNTQCKGLYADDWSSDISAHHNVLIDCGAASVQNHDGDNNSYNNNIMALLSGGTKSLFTDEKAIWTQGADTSIPSTPIPTPNGVNVVGDDNIILSIDSGRNPVSYGGDQCFQTSSLTQDFSSLDGNTKWQSIGDHTVETNANNADPGFADPANDNYFLSSLPGNFTHIVGVTDTNTSGPPSSWGTGGYSRANY